MTAFHSTSALPYLARNNNKPYKIDEFELYNTVLSALLWRKINGKIIMVADSVSYNYYKKIGIDKVWNKLINGIPDDLEGINPQMFWAAGKLLALREMSAPIVMIDTDFIVWKKLDFGGSIIAAHKESISDNVYPDYTRFEMKQGYSFNSGWDKEVLALNTAFLYLPDEDFKQYYVNKAIEFMKRAKDCDDYLCRMVFAEQRLLALTADELKVSVKTLMDKDKLFFPQNKYTHLWGAKRIMRQDKKACDDFILSCKRRITTDFPEFAYVITHISQSEALL